MKVLPRRVLSFAMVVCFACTPSAVLACAVRCVPGMMSHGALSDGSPAAGASGHEHMHHAMPAGAAAFATSASTPDSQHHVETVARATVVASSDAIGPDCCTHTRGSTGASTRASRADTAAVAAPAAGPFIVMLPPDRALAAVRATPIDDRLATAPTRAPLVLRI